MLFDTLDMGLMDANAMAEALIKWLSEDDCKRFAEIYEIRDIFENLNESLKRDENGNLTSDAWEKVRDTLAKNNKFSKDKEELAKNAHKEAEEYK